MCGIVAYNGNNSAQEILLDGLKSLEYRGYDSAGLALMDQDQKVELIKTKGKVAELEKVTAGHGKQSASISQIGIGHTRWATHGEANITNAHPHQDYKKKISLVHNGIIKNYFQLKQELEKQGIQFSTETDTEIVSNLFSLELENNDTLQALQNTINKLEGSYALAILIEGSDQIIATKHQSPMVIGFGEEGNFVASDSSTVLQFTNKIYRLQDGEIALVSKTGIKVFNSNLEAKEIQIEEAERVNSLLSKGPYKHFLMKEIHEQAAVISSILAECDFANIEHDFSQIERVNILACGSAYYAGLVGKYLIELWAKIPCEVHIASEFCSFPTLVNEKDLVIGISQSGETADTISAIRNAEAAGAKVMAITNKADSAIADICKPNTYVTPAGIEVSVASTKAFTAQVISLYLLAIKIAETKQPSSPETSSWKDLKNELRKLPLIMDQVIERAESYREQMLKYSSYRDFLFLSRGVNYPIALEGALKLKELSYIHATGYPAGEMKHGPIAILDQNVPVLTVAINGESALEQMVYKKTLSNAEEARARKSPSILITNDSNHDMDDIFDEIIRVPNVSQLFSPLIAVIPLQFLAYFIAEDLGKDVDQPRNLAKSVTVE